MLGDGGEGVGDGGLGRRGVDSDEDAGGHLVGSQGEDAADAALGGNLRRHVRRLLLRSARGRRHGDGIAGRRGVLEVLLAGGGKARGLRRGRRKEGGGVSKEPRKMKMFCHSSIDNY